MNRSISGFLSGDGRWFCRRSGSRASIQNPVRPWGASSTQSHDETLCPLGQPGKAIGHEPRIEPWFGTAQPICLSAPGTDRRRHDSIMNLWNWSDHSVSLQYGGWTARPFSRCFTVAGEVFVLTSPFIERDYRNVGIGQKPVTDKVGGLKGSTQHWLAVYPPECEIPRFVEAGY